MLVMAYLRAVCKGQGEDPQVTAGGERGRHMHFLPRFRPLVHRGPLQTTHYPSGEGEGEHIKCLRHLKISPEILTCCEEHP